MSRHGLQHEQLDEHGIGKCSVPMWQMGCPAGFCDKDAYGKRPHSDTWMNYAAGRRMRVDLRYDGYVPALACPIHGGPPSRAFKDGAAWCAVFPDFIDLQASPAGFGDTPEQARAQLASTTGRDAT